jgi:hydroxymethylpyrimidine pyrophosphatase-like HAD family hydrolase
VRSTSSRPDRRHANGSLAVTYSTAAFLEIAAAGVDKGSALAWLSDRLGIAPAEVIAFGDMPNDLAMLRWAGRAVAVANAHPEVLAAAHEITPSNGEDGVALCWSAWSAVPPDG